MPYVKQDQRQALESALQVLADALANSSTNETIDGDLNYVISRLVSKSLTRLSGGDAADWKYRDIARAVAVFECAKLEFYRRMAGPKEDRAILANGDIPEYAAAPHETVVILKPDALRRGCSDYILKGLLPFKVIQQQKFELIARSIWEQHYADHKDKHYFQGLLDFMTSGPVLALIVEGNVLQIRERALACRATLGGCDGPANLVHTSDSVAAAAREVALWRPFINVGNR